MFDLHGSKSQCLFLVLMQRLNSSPSVILLLQHPRVPVLGQHPEPQEQHEDATFGFHPLHLVSLCVF